ncbi:MAG: aminotransferase class V-fold PLP-dependent enzyme [Alphaproteobacteria bacterium]|nr:aminotransferase class V-fold PLP-dependent enzyme [Alphaproteobacteria bacterium]
MPADVSLDIEFVRAQFPPLADGWAFLENAGGSYVPGSVIDSTVAYMSESQVQPGIVGASKLASERIAAGQNGIATALGAEADEVIIGPSTSMNVYVLSHAVRPWLRPGDEVIVTNLDHEANNTPWRRLEEIGVTVKEWCFNPDTGGLDSDALSALLTDRTRFVCFSACSNITGTINDVAGLTALAHEAGAVVCVDAVALGSHRAIDVKALDVDFLACSIYKLYGPHVAALYGKREHFLRAKGQNHYFFGEDTIPLKLNPGGVNHEFTAALKGVIDYFDSVYAYHFMTPANDVQARVRAVYGLFEDFEERLVTPFVDYLESTPSIRLLGLMTADKTRRVPTFSIDVPGKDLAAIQAMAAARQVNIGLSHFYAPRALEGYGLDAERGVLRISMVHYNNADDVQRAIAAIDEALSAG